MSEFWSFSVDSMDEVVYPDLLLSVGPGRDVFNLALDDPRAFVDDLASKGVRVLHAVRLDAPEEIPLDFDRVGGPHLPEPAHETLPEAHLVQIP